MRETLQCLAMVFVKIRISSRYTHTMPSRIKSWKMSFIIVWKVEGELVNPKKHHQWLEKSTIHMKGCLPLITFFHTHIIVSPTNITFSEILPSSKLIHEVRNQR